jgi:hypothetical protein
VIPKQLNDIAEADLIALISNGVAEGRTIDYKRTLPGGTDGDKKEFLADTSSFANTGGGDLVYGMDESGGLPTQLVGLQAADLDAEIRRLDSILGAGLSPRIRYVIRTISTAAGPAVVIRVDRSWSGPHRVVFAGHDKFYGRNSAGKYSLDVNELRAAFTLLSTVTERIRAFRTDRLIALSNNQTPLPFVDSPKVVLHCISIGAFAGGFQYDLKPIYDNQARLGPLGSSWNRRLNLDGVLAFAGGNPSVAYMQLYRTGIIEAVQGSLLGRSVGDRRLIPSLAYEERILQYLPSCFGILQTIGCDTPIVVALSLLRTRGLFMSTSRFDFTNDDPIMEENIILPETVVEDLSAPAERILKPMFDLVWNACGLRESLNFDGEGNWRPRQ